MLDLAHSAGGNDKSNSPDPNPGAESADGFQARVPTRVRELKESSYILLIVRRRKRSPSS